MQQFQIPKRVQKMQNATNFKNPLACVVTVLFRKRGMTSISLFFRKKNNKK
jgi:hypothetical protein